MQHELFLVRLVPTPMAQTCDRCGQVVKLYERRLRSSWCKVLLGLFRHDEAQPGGWVNLDNAHAVGAAAARDWSLLRFWSLIESDRKRAGFWRITPEGRMFIADGTLQPVAAWIFNATCYGWSKEQVTFERVLAGARMRRIAA